MTNANDSKQPSPPAPSNNPVSGGIFIALGLLGGTVVGFMNDQISAGMIGGFGVGIGIAVVVYLIDRRR
jgi:formate/nitrite transporter FocA (FNT family)